MEAGNGNGVQDGHSGTAGLHGEETENGEVEDVLEDPPAPVYRCNSCRAVFVRKGNFNRHLLECNGGSDSMERATVDRAVKLASSLVYEGSQEHDIIYSRTGVSVHLREMIVDLSIDSVVLSQGWADRPPDGYRLGPNHTPRYAPLIDAWTEIGRDDPDRRMTPGMMLRTLKSMFPRNYDIPTERHLGYAVKSQPECKNPGGSL